MSFHCANKTIPSEISRSGNYLRLKGNKVWNICPGPGDLANQICPGVGNLTKKIARGAGIWPVSNNLPQGCPEGGGGMVTLGTD